MIARAIGRMRSFVRGSVEARDWFGGGLALAIVLSMGAALSVSLGDAPARFFMERFHLRTHSFALWSAFAASPWMYNFENRVLVSSRPLSSGERERPPAGLSYRYINHFPPRALTFAEERVSLPQDAPVYLYMESRYRGLVVQSALRLVVEREPGQADQRGRGPGRAFLERVSLSP